MPGPDGRAFFRVPAWGALLCVFQLLMARYFLKFAVNPAEVSSKGEPARDRLAPARCSGFTCGLFQDKKI
jgi:hypothetical protein